jgi:uncharacterized delta-60 repeat protein
VKRNTSADCIRGRIVLAGLVLLLSSAPLSSAAPGDLDLTFDSGSETFNGSVWSLALQPDGKILIVGDFAMVRTLARSGIARLNPDGSVRQVVVQPDGKVLIGGSFAMVDHVRRTRVARLNEDGSLDPTFDPGELGGLSSQVSALALQPDGRVLIGGSFTSIAGVDRKGIAGLNGDGTLDTSFDPASDFIPGVSSLTVQPDGNILAGGWGTMTRLTSSAAPDSSFNPIGLNGQVNSIALQIRWKDPDCGRILQDQRRSAKRGRPPEQRRNFRQRF